MGTHDFLFISFCLFGSVHFLVWGVQKAKLFATIRTLNFLGVLVANRKCEESFFSARDTG